MDNVIICQSNFAFMIFQGIILLFICFCNLYTIKKLNFDIILEIDISHYYIINIHNVYATVWPLLPMAVNVTKKNNYCLYMYIFCMQSSRYRVGGRFGQRSRLVAAHFALYQCQKRSGSRPVNLPSRFANFNCFNSKTSVYFYYKISVFQTAILKGRNRNSYEYKNCTTDPYSGKITSVNNCFI